MPVRTLLLFGLAAALCWTAADILLVGFPRLPPTAAPFAPDVAAALADDADMAALMLGGSPERLFWGVLPATFSIILYLAASWGVYRLMRPSALAKAAWLLLLCSYAWSPLGHAGFYYVGMAAQGLAAAPPHAQGIFLAQFRHFMDMLAVHWLAAVGLSILAWTAVLLQTLRGRTILPKWAALFNPVPVGVAIALGCSFFPESVAAASLGGASLNAAQLVFFATAWCLVKKTQ
ncbi:MAG: hypothetical protein Q3966_09510 [Neisseria sp.]|nr:hypothetical protein [Neisseria sp.]